LYLSLGPSLASQLLATDSRAAGGVVILALAGIGAISAVVVRSGERNRLLVGGSVLVIVGVSITLMGQFLSSVALLYGGSIVAGVGLGLASPLRSGNRTPGGTRTAGRLGRGDLRSGLSVLQCPTVLAGAAVTHHRPCADSLRLWRDRHRARRDLDGRGITSRSRSPLGERSD
jgi:hypothetical protein